MPALGGENAGETDQGGIFTVQGRRGQKVKSIINTQTVLYTCITNKTGREKGGDHEISFILWWCFVFVFVFKEG
uniref:Uncharacterized protein n=2 Tax=Cercopithecinae TaxID=9528 RepID=A0A2K5KK75_CERAT